MAVIKDKSIRTDDYVLVTWSNVSSADTCEAHVSVEKPDLATVQFEGDFGAGLARLTVSLSDVSYVTAYSLQNNPISVSTNSLVSVLDTGFYWKPEVTGDDVTVTLLYWI